MQLKVSPTQLMLWRRRECWKHVVGWEGYYMVSSFGNVRNWRTKRILKQGMTGKGYPGVRLCKNGKMGSQRVHNLVIEAFVGPKPEGKEVNHKDTSKTNNRIDNLEYITHQENMKHAWKNGIMKSSPGIKNWQAKLTDTKVLKIIKLHAKGTRQRHIAWIFKVDECTICDILKGRTWKHVTGAR